MARNTIRRTTSEQVPEGVGKDERDRNREITPSWEGVIPDIARSTLHHSSRM
ncbi:hypothetical protein [Fodinibius sediminis]|uniref:hypothetical protein n=1 Tax=Fodinibius sediminis TaxID=1214077 RepID=UPI00163D6B93|nr:hypothetical protein [Fodinibius sediminis]